MATNPMLTTQKIQAANAAIHAPIAGGYTRNCGHTLREAMAFAERHADSSVCVIAEGNGAKVVAGRGHGHTPGSADAWMIYPSTDPSAYLAGDLRAGCWTWRVLHYEVDDGKPVQLIKEQPINADQIHGI